MSICASDAARTVVGLAHNHLELERLHRLALDRIAEGSYPHLRGKTGAVLLQRADQTAEARQAAWERDFFDVDRAGRRRRRYKASQVEKDWIEWVKQSKRDAREQARIRNAGRG